MPERNPAYAPLIGASAEVVYQLAVRDPLAVTRALSRALKSQTAGAKVTAVRLLAEAMEASEPGTMRKIADELARHLEGKR